MANAIITCRLCARRFDKGVPADPTQDDSSFVCAPCAHEHKGYPQNGWINPLVLRPDLANEKLEKPASSLLKRLSKKLAGK